MNTQIIDASEDMLTSAQGKITYLGEQSIPILTIIFLTAQFKLTVFSLAAIQNETNDAEATEKLKILIGEKYWEYDAFLERITTLLGNEKTLQYQSLILENAFFEGGNYFKLEPFLQLQSSPEPYGNDNIPHNRPFLVTPKEMHRMLSAVSPICKTPNVSAGHNFLSFAVIRRQNDQLIGNEYRINQKYGKGFCQRLISGLDSRNRIGREMLTELLINIYP